MFHSAATLSALVSLALLLSLSRSSCPGQFEEAQEFCYLIVNNETYGYRWQGGRDLCTRLGGDLASLETPRESSIARYFVQRKFNLISANCDDNDWVDSVWVGGQDLGEETEWRWVSSGLLFAFSDWQAGQPEGGTRENCLLLRCVNDYRWNDVDCSYRYPILCEATPTQ
ncbi:unnamed protein product [Cyprideis torosa]|uniref:Uncharacterized protein n=1 Tax=Cyprideis torosa TaxID=163714 RepID=A0A7R8W330_9CRUS|nr:unnamed protein product [Cyprideis torosa]CAG0881683.1 unnamed protein product [Cyprideis torosa]